MPAALLPTIETPAPRKRVATMRERPARMIDDALRRRAIEAVERAVALQDAPV